MLLHHRARPVAAPVVDDDLPPKVEPVQAGAKLAQTASNEAFFVESRNDDREAWEG